LNDNTDGAKQASQDLPLTGTERPTLLSSSFFCPDLFMLTPLPPSLPLSLLSSPQCLSINQRAFQYLPQAFDVLAEKKKQTVAILLV
jgi:hypothetical protein